MEKQIVHLFVFNTLADWETGFAVAGINNPALQKHPRRYRVQTVGLDAEPVTTIGGVYPFTVGVSRWTTTGEKGNCTQ